MKEINGKLYSNKEFESYKFRAKVEYDTGEPYKESMDVYTTEENKEIAEQSLESIRKNSLIPIKIIYWSSKEQDEASSVLVDEVLKDL